VECGLLMLMFWPVVWLIVTAWEMIGDRALNVTQCHMADVGVV
jgi:hypothetical protein